MSCSTCRTTSRIEARPPQPGWSILGITPSPFASPDWERLPAVLA
ncbi:MAG: hypothetical protein U1E17_04115 [Geminicoccaceae bacterium]